MAGGNLDGAGGTSFPHENADRWRRGHVDVDTVASARGECGDDRSTEHGAAAASVPPDHDRTVGNRTGKSGDISGRDDRIERFPDNASQPANADDQLAHHFTHSIFDVNPATRPGTLPQSPPYAVVRGVTANRSAAINEVTSGQLIAGPHCRVLSRTNRIVAELADKVTSEFSLFTWLAPAATETTGHHDRRNN